MHKTSYHRILAAEVLDKISELVQCKERKSTIFHRISKINTKELSQNDIQRKDEFFRLDFKFFDRIAGQNVL